MTAYYKYIFVVLLIATICHKITIPLSQFSDYLRDQIVLQSCQFNPVNRIYYILEVGIHIYCKICHKNVFLLSQFSDYLRDQRVFLPDETVIIVPFPQ